jgi:hypothetical protein
VGDDRCAVSLAVPRADAPALLPDLEAPWRALAATALGVVGADWRILTVSAELADLSGRSVDELVGLGRLTARLQGCAEEADAAMAELWRIADVLSPGVREPTPEGVCIVHDLGPAPYVAGQLEEAWKERAGPVRTAIGLIQELDEMRPARSGET